MCNDSVIKATKNWVDRFVIDLNLCPFAKAEIYKKSVRFKVSSAQTEKQLLTHLQQELNFLTEHSTVETTLLIHPKALNDFIDYNSFLENCDELLIDMQLDGIYQIASFHPDYQFAETHYDDAENFSNRSPYPMLHILREASLERALEKYPKPESIPLKNIQTLNELGSKHCHLLLEACFRTTHK